MKMLGLCGMLIFCLGLNLTANAHHNNINELIDNHELGWSIMVYHGRMTDNTLGQVLGFDYKLDNDKLYSGEIAYYFTPETKIRQWIGPLSQTVSLVLNTTIHDDKSKTIYEVDPYFSFRWYRFPWSHYLITSIGLGEGLSYVDKVPSREYRNSREPKRLLNYLMFEVSVALPQFPQAELIGRIHHRSGVFGLYNANNSGSTAVGLGFRVYF